MNIVRYDSGAAYLREAEPFLVTNEAANCLVLGLAMQFALYPGLAAPAPFLAVVKEKDQVLAAAIMTAGARLVLAVTESRAALAGLAEHVAGVARTTPGVHGQTPVSRWFADEWQRLTGDQVRPLMSQRIYRADRITPPSGVPGVGRRASASDRDLLIEWFTAFDLESFGTMSADTPARVDSYFEMSTRGAYLWENAGPVSLAAYSGHTLHGARVGPVYTPPAQRGRGFGSAVTAVLSQHLLDSDRQFCCLFANLANPTPNHIYQTIGYTPVCDVAEYQFSPVTA